MNEKVMRFSNKCIYGQLMECANEEVKTRKADLKISCLGETMFISKVLDPNREIIFIDYHSFARKNRDDILEFTKTRNDLEADICVDIVKEMLSVGYDVIERLAIITPFVDQEEELKSKIGKEVGEQYDEIVYTIDKSQGMEKETVIVSFVKCNPKTKLLKDMNRINVAFTRAQSKLILVGHLKTLKNIGGLQEFIGQLEQQECILEYEKEIN